MKTKSLDDKLFVRTRSVWNILFLPWGKKLLKSLFWSPFMETQNLLAVCCFMLYSRNRFTLKIGHMLCSVLEFGFHFASTLTILIFHEWAEPSALLFQGDQRKYMTKDATSQFCFVWHSQLGVRSGYHGDGTFFCMCVKRVLAALHSQNCKKPKDDLKSFSVLAKI